MTQTAFNFLPSPATLKITPQERTLYARLLIGGIRNCDMKAETDLLHYSRRLTSIRRALEAEYGWTVSKRWLGNGIFEYFLKQLEQINQAA